MFENSLEADRLADSQTDLTELVSYLNSTPEAIKLVLNATTGLPPANVDTVVREP
jgi:hypothetical protein